VRVRVRALDLIAAILLCSLAVRHYQIRELANFFGFSVYAMNYMLDGVLDVVLVSVIAFLVWGYKGVARFLILTGCVWAALEGVQVSGCRFFANMSHAPAQGNLCDYLLGFPVGALVGVLVLMTMCLIIWLSDER